MAARSAATLPEKSSSVSLHVTHSSQHPWIHCMLSACLGGRPSLPAACAPQQAVASHFCRIAHIPSPAPDWSWRSIAPRRPLPSAEEPACAARQGTDAVPRACHGCCALHLLQGKGSPSGPLKLLKRHAPTAFPLSCIAREVAAQGRMGNGYSTRRPHAPCIAGQPAQPALHAELALMQPK